MGASFTHGEDAARGLFILTTEELPPMTLLTSTFFYDRKLRIALLTLATFAALC